MLGAGCRGADERAAKINRDKKAVRLLPIPRLSLGTLSGSRGNSVRETQAMHMRHASIFGRPPSPRTHGTEFVPWPRANRVSGVVLNDQRVRFQLDDISEAA